MHRPHDSNPEANRIREAYKRRQESSVGSRYRATAPAAIQIRQERERALVNLFQYLESTFKPIEDLTLLEIGCGNGGKLLDLIQLGFRPENLVGNELLENRLSEARHRLPSAIELIEGDASNIANRSEAFDIVYQAVVFSSILDSEVKKALAEKMWDWVKPGGGVLWYDFSFNNPSNPDVKGISKKELKDLFPEGRIKTYRITLAPPVARFVSRIHPSLYLFFNIFPFLRTHVLAWIEKPQNKGHQ